MKEYGREERGGRREERSSKYTNGGDGRRMKKRTKGGRIKESGRAKTVDDMTKLIE